MRIRFRLQLLLPCAVCISATLLQACGPSVKFVTAADGRQVRVVTTTTWDDQLEKSCEFVCFKGLGVGITWKESAITADLTGDLDPAHPQAFFLRNADTWNCVTAGDGGCWAYACGDPAKARARAAKSEYERRMDSVRITNRQDVIRGCQFVKNAQFDTSYQRTIQFGVAPYGNVYYVISGSSQVTGSSTDETRDLFGQKSQRTQYESSTTTTGEIYQCPPK